MMEMRLSAANIRPDNDGWDPVKGDYYKQYSSLISDPQLRAKAEEQMQRIVLQAEESRRARELQRSQEIVKAQQASREQSRHPAKAAKLVDYQEQMRLLGEQEKMRIIKR
ncbi:hypothetical protein ONS95_011269 [Cadophora gregata]|uniref:uncharacterized protein n=1 Tax=Cadophora gregata TaxID=51156 RepID=UPI0026DD690D|nr:uncharacterized protein ONS95_011269 [Cadophora gregata]KAK0119837.1 hypothetical protein ONS95_011269 [Cadophora gregata]KAK0120872.1 hypothetical protein ONS96_011072 [Cadophora gregata f. sp. sojae]